MLSVPSLSPHMEPVTEHTWVSWGWADQEGLPDEVAGLGPSDEVGAGSGAPCPPEPSSSAFLHALLSAFSWFSHWGWAGAQRKRRRVMPGYPLPWHPPCLATVGRCALEQEPEVLSGGPVILALGFRSLKLLLHPHSGPGVVSVSLVLSQYLGFLSIETSPW